MTGAPPQPHLVAYSDADQVAGAEQSLATVLEHLDPSVKVTVAGTNLDTLEYLIAGRPRADIALLPSLATKADMRSVIGVSRTLRSMGPSILHLNKTDIGNLRYVECVAKTVRSMRVVSVVHHVERPEASTVRWLCRRLAPRADAIVAVGDSLARQLEAILRLPPGRVHTITNAVTSARPTRRAADGRFVVGVLARLVPHKAVDDVIAAVATMEDVHLLIGGDGPDRTRLERLAWRSGAASRIEFLGWVDPDRVFDHCDMIASAATIEGHPITLLDARGRGLPVVAADVGAVGSIVDDGVTGFLVRPGHVDGLADAIATLAGDQRLLVSMGLAARAAAMASGGPDSMARAYSELYWPAEDPERPHSTDRHEPDARPDQPGTEPPAGEPGGQR